MYVLQGVIARSAVLAEITDRSVLLGQGFALLPLLTDADPALLASWSVHGPLVFVEADFFGGVGTQLAQVWEHGRLVLDLAEDSPFPTVTPISTALRQLGVVKGEHCDEFDAVGLGRHRETEDWLSEQA